MISVYDAVFTEADAQAAANAVRSGILSSFGSEVKKLESDFAKFIGTKHALSCTSGTTALYLALAPLIRPGDTVAVPTCSYAATAFAAIHHGAKVEFVDADPNTWNMDLDALERLCQTKRIHAVIAVYNYGNPLDMIRLMEIANKYGVFVVEDACEALGATFDGKKVGSFGEVGVFSFYGNKTISCGEGGMVVVNSDVYADRMKLERGQGQDPNRRFWHLTPGWNFRLTNLQAAVVNSQFSRFEQIQKRKLEIYARYRDHLNADLLWQEAPTKGSHCWWMVSVRHWRAGWYQDASQYLAANGIETRPIFPPIHKMPAAFQDIQAPVAEHIWDTGITLPSGPSLTDDQIDHICDVVNEIV